MLQKCIQIGNAFRIRQTSTRKSGPGQKEIIISAFAACAFNALN